MKYQNLGKTDIKVSRISFGAWGLGGGKVWSDMSLDVKEISDLLDYASDLGINYIDTAPVYGIGTSEMILGKALKGRRDRFIVQTKCSLNWRNEGGEFEYIRDGYTVMKDHHASAIRKDVEDSLMRMDLDCIDSMVVHRMSSVVSPEETMNELQKLIKEGKIRTVFLSNSTPDDLKEYSKYGLVAGVQEKFSLLSQKQRRYFDACKEYGTMFQAYGVLEEGGLTSRNVVATQWPEEDVRSTRIWSKEPMRSAVLELFDQLEPLCEKYGCSMANLVQAWTLTQYENLNLLTGFRRRQTMADTVKVLDLKVEDADLALITEAAEKTQK